MRMNLVMMNLTIVYDNVMTKAVFVNGIVVDADIVVVSLN